MNKPLDYVRRAEGAVSMVDIVDRLVDDLTAEEAVAISVLCLTLGRRIAMRAADLAGAHAGAAMAGVQIHMYASQLMKEKKS
jgi:hypothetical protein